MATKQEKAKAKAIKLLKKEAKEKIEAEARERKEAEQMAIKAAKKRELRKIAKEAKTKAKKIKEGNLTTRRKKNTLDDPITIYGFTFPKRSYFLVTILSVFTVILLVVASFIPQGGDVAVKIRVGCYDYSGDPCEVVNVLFTDENGNERGLAAFLADDGYWEYNYEKWLEKGEEWYVNVTLEEIEPGSKYLAAGIFSDDVTVASQISEYGDESLSISGIAMYRL